MTRGAPAATGQRFRFRADLSTAFPGREVSALRRVVREQPGPVAAERRARLLASLVPGSVAVLATAPEVARNSDCDYLYRYDSSFYYLTGFTEPHATLVITAEGEVTLFCQPKDLEREIWDGIRLGPDAAPAALGVSRAMSSADRVKSNMSRFCFMRSGFTDLGIIMHTDIYRARTGVRCGR